MTYHYGLICLMASTPLVLLLNGCSGSSSGTDNTSTTRVAPPTLNITSPTPINSHNISSYFLLGNCATSQADINFTLSGNSSTTPETPLSTQGTITCLNNQWQTTIDDILFADFDDGELSLEVTEGAVTKTVTVIKDTAVPIVGTPTQDSQRRMVFCLCRLYGLSGHL